MRVFTDVVTVTAMTHRGAVRRRNEDSLVVGAFVVSDRDNTEPVTLTVPVRGPVVLAVADGVGGHAHGEVASANTVAGLARHSADLVDETAIATVLGDIDQELRGLGAAHPEFEDTATTVAGLVIDPMAVTWFNVGDSRVYRIVDGRLEQVSIDDSPPTVGGTVTHIVTQVLGGMDPGLEPHIGRTPRKGPSRWLLCSDGLSDLVPGPTIEQILFSEEDDIKAVRILWTVAMNASGRDNITILLVSA